MYFFFFFKLYKPKNLYLDRSDTNVSKINDIISFLYLKYFIGEQKDKINYFSYNLFFERIKKIGLNKILFKFLKENIPKFFFSKSIIKNVNISTYPINFLFEKNYQKIIFFFKNIKITGYQHGAGYGHFANSLLYNFERKLSDKFIDWYPINQSKYIGRFEKKKNLKKSKKIYWVGSAFCNKFESF